ncbi:MAG: PIN domain-containing protein [Sphaerobacter sp.]|nr:PIN domain-containing protein [Sphaerobacter sp.]
MSRLLLDTCALIAYAKGHEPARSRILDLIDSGAEIGVCAINVAEFYSRLPPGERTRWQRFFDTLEYWDIPLTAAILAGSDRYDFKRRGRSLSVADVLIAATARQHGAVVVTDNVRDYPMAGIEILPQSEGR